MQEKDNEIRMLVVEKPYREKELESSKANTAELEQKILKKTKILNNKKNAFSKQEEEIGLQCEKDLCDLRKQILEENYKSKRKEMEIQDLEKQLLQKELEKLTLIRIFEDEKRALQRERDELKVELAERTSEDEKCKRIAIEQKQEEEDHKHRAAENLKEEADRDTKMRNGDARQQRRDARKR